MIKLLRSNKCTRLVAGGNHILATAIAVHVREEHMGV